jgi:cell division septation protein DedD
MKRSAILLILGMLLLVAPSIQTIAAPLAQTSGQITSPRDQATVRGLVPIEGSATHTQFQKYEVHYGPEPNPGDQWTPIGGSPFSVPVVQGRLGLWDTTILPEGRYSLRLRVVRLDGNYDEYFVRGIQVANLSPTDTPTPAETPTPAPPTNTPAPTPTVVISVPTVSSPTPRPTSTPLPTALPTITPTPMDLPFQSVGDAACWGVGATLVAFGSIGLFFAFKSGLVSLLRKVTRQNQDT